MNTNESAGAIGEEPELYTPPEMAALCRVPMRTIEKWIFEKRLPVVRVGRLVRFPRVEIQKRILSGKLLFDKKR